MCVLLVLTLTFRIAILNSLILQRLFGWHCLVTSENLHGRSWGPCCLLVGEARVKLKSCRRSARLPIRRLILLETLSRSATCPNCGAGVVQLCTQHSLNAATNSVKLENSKTPDFTRVNGARIAHLVRELIISRQLELRAPVIDREAVREHRPGRLARGGAVGVHRALPHNHQYRGGGGRVLHVLERCAEHPHFQQQQSWQRE